MTMLVAAGAIGLMVGCGADSGVESSSMSTSTSDSAPDATDDSGSTPAPTAAAVDAEAIVSASGGGALPIEVSGLTVLADPSIGQPWLRFDLVLDCCGDPNATIVFAGGDDTDIGAPPALRLSGPACAGAITCADGGRTVSLTAPEPVPLTFELTPLVDAAGLLQAGTLQVQLTPTLDPSHPGLDDETMTIDLRIDIRAPTPAPSGETTPVRTPAAPVTTVGAGFQLLTFPVAAYADDASQLAAILVRSTEPVDANALGVDWTTHAAIVLTIPTDGCPPLLGGLDVTDRRAQPVFVNAGYPGCIEPLLSHTVIATVERTALADVDELVLPADPLYFETPVVTPVAVTPGGPPPPPASPPTPDFGAVAGSVALPPIGEATVATLADGAPVYVVHHHDGTVSALDPRASIPEYGNETESQLQLVSWTAATRILLGAGAWDEYGRRLDGFRSTDLLGFATRVNGDVVEIGAPVDPPLGSPIAATADPPATSDVAIPLTDPIGLDAAVGLPAGSTALIDASVIVDPDGAHVCAMTSQAFPVAACPPGSPSVDGIAPITGARYAWFGPILATRTETGFTRVAPTGGYAGGTL